MGDWPIIFTRFALYADLMLLFGLAAFGLYALRGAERGPGGAIAFRPWLAGGAVAGLLLSAAGMLLLVAGMLGASPFEVDRETFDMVATGTPVGKSWLVRVAMLGLALLAAFAAGRGPAASLAAVALLSGVALSTLAWTGHGAMDEGMIGWAHLGADILHLLASGIWIGALIGLLLLVFRPLDRADAAHLRLSRRALDGFSTIGTVVVGTLLITGLVNGWLLVGPGHLLDMATGLYGQLLLGKLALFVAMLLLAALNRFRLTPAFAQALATGDHQAALFTLRRSLAVETGCAVAILASVAWLGTLAPPASGL
ncbi:copper resistance protein CopD [Sphingomonas oleivorans]|uniref:Copper resistance protein CopD n=1 Tax=Sphingomonas oleivorans TaxID=1735121 RepID=A0A2T5G0L1_9SPHN|nr:copper homeostasis membrane protein CopD [Sphingomonas oleivorans]PTQ12689.1 copper resistance protein CopD [Sphingomonas oleivorans]